MRSSATGLTSEGVRDHHPRELLFTGRYPTNHALGEGGQRCDAVLYRLIVDTRRRSYLRARTSSQRWVFPRSIGSRYRRLSDIATRTSTAAITRSITVSLIQISELKRLAIPLPTIEIQKQIVRSGSLAMLAAAPHLVSGQQLGRRAPTGLVPTGVAHDEAGVRFWTCQGGGKRGAPPKSGNYGKQPCPPGWHSSDCVPPLAFSWCKREICAGRSDIALHTQIALLSSFSHYRRRGLALTYVSAARNAQESKYRGSC
jgi:hypothetical protein